MVISNILALAYSLFQGLHDRIELICMSYLINIHIDDFTSSRSLLIHQAIPNLIYLLSTFAYHYLYFIYGFLVDFFILYTNQLIVKGPYEQNKIFIALRVVAAGLSLLPIIYLAGFTVRKSSDPNKTSVCPCFIV